MTLAASRTSSCCRTRRGTPPRPSWSAPSAGFETTASRSSAS
jgi:hypothetical protein